MRSLLVTILGGVVATTAFAQWLDFRTPGIPRLPNGQPNLTAAAPKTPDGHPDLSGIWQVKNLGTYSLLNLAADLKPTEIQPWAATLFQQRSENYIRDNPFFRCLPPIGPATSLGVLGMYRILQTPGVIAFLPEGSYGPSSYRQIFMDGRDLPKSPNPIWQGYSIGHWDGETLVVEATGFNEQTWLDLGGHPHTEELRITERFYRRDFGHLELKTTFDDPKVYARPWTISVVVDLAPDTELLEYVCNENERSADHFVVTEADRNRFRNTAQLVPELLSKYTGVYEAPRPSGNPFTYTVSMGEGQLMIQAPGIFGGKFPLSAQTQDTFTIFSPYLAEMSIQFIADATGRVTELVAHFSQGEQRAIRKRDLP
jgi:hypothetical protein